MRGAPVQPDSLWLTLLAGAVLLTGCVDTGAPDGSTIAVTVNPVTLGSGGAVAQVSALVRSETGQTVADETVVVFTTTLGGLCDHRGCGAADSLPAALHASTTDGIARAFLVSGTGSGTATVTVWSGRAEGTATVTISGLVAPFGARSVLTADPDTVAKGAPFVIRAYLTDSTGTPLATNTRVVLEASPSPSPSVIALTTSGFAEAAFLADTSAGLTIVRIRSGPLQDSVAVTVQ